MNKNDEAKKIEMQLAIQCWDEYLKSNPEQAKTIMENYKELGFKQIKVKSKDGSSRICYVPDGTFDVEAELKALEEKANNVPELEDYLEEQIQKGVSEEDAMQAYLDTYF